VCVRKYLWPRNRQELAPNTPAQVGSGSVSPRKRPLSKLRGTDSSWMINRGRRQKHRPVTSLFS
jgi:hypothetical protein